MGEEISSIEPPPWALGAFNILSLFDGTYGLGLCKRFDRNQLKPSKPFLLNFPTVCMDLGHATKQNKINKINGLSPLSDWA